MMRRGFRAPAALAALASLALGTGGGCSVLNPSLVAGFGVSPTTALDPIEGTILITVMNTVADLGPPTMTVPPNVTATVRVHKQNGGSILLNIPAAPFNAGSDEDHITVIQDCDVSMIEFVGARVQGVDGIIGENLPPLVVGQTLFCGNVVAIWITRSGTGYFANMSVF